MRPASRPRYPRVPTLAISPLTTEPRFGATVRRPGCRQHSRCFRRRCSSARPYRRSLTTATTLCSTTDPAHAPPVTDTIRRAHLRRQAGRRRSKYRRSEVPSSLPLDTAGPCAQFAIPSRILKGTTRVKAGVRPLYHPSEYSLSTDLTLTHGILGLLMLQRWDNDLVQTSSRLNGGGVGV